MVLWLLWHCFLSYFPKFELGLPFVILHHHAVLHQNWSITVWVILITAWNWSFSDVLLSPVTLTFNRFFCIANLAFLLSFYTIMPNFIKIGQELFEISWLQTDRHTGRQTKWSHTLHSQLWWGQQNRLRPLPHLALSWLSQQHSVLH